MHEDSLPINVDPGTPPPHDSQLDGLANYSAEEFSNGWSFLVDDTPMKEHLSLQTPSFYDGNQSPYLTSPLSSASSLPSLSPLANVLHDFQLGEQSAGNGDDLPLVEAWSVEQDTLAASFSNSSRATDPEQLRLQIPTNAHDEMLSPATSVGSFNGNALETPSYMSDQSNMEPFCSPNAVYFPNSVPFFQPNDWLSPTDLGPQVSVQRRHSCSKLGASNNLTSDTSTASSFTPSLLSHTSAGKGSLSQHRYSHSDAGSIASFTSHGDSALSPTLLSPTYLPSADHNPQHRRHSHSNTDAPKPTDPPALRRTRSLNDHREAGSSQADHSRTTDHLWRNNRSTPPPDEDVFRSYEGRSGVAYPILHRDTIASDAVLRASASRRKKVPTYRCPKCGQLLTSKDNLNNHQDAHEGIRRHRCEFCHDRFRTRSVLKRHQKSAKCPGSRLAPKKQE